MSMGTLGECGMNGDTKLDTKVIGTHCSPRSGWGGWACLLRESKKKKKKTTTTHEAGRRGESEGDGLDMVPMTTVFTFVSTLGKCGDPQ